MIKFIVLTLSYMIGLGIGQQTGWGSGWGLALLAFAILAVATGMWVRRHLEHLSEEGFWAVLGRRDVVPIDVLLLACCGLLVFGICRYTWADRAINPRHLDLVMVSDDPWTPWRVRGVVVEEPVLTGEILTAVVAPDLVQSDPRPAPRVGSHRGRGSGSGSVGSGSGSASRRRRKSAGSGSGRGRPRQQGGRRRQLSVGDAGGTDIGRRPAHPLVTTGPASQLRSPPAVWLQSGSGAGPVLLDPQTPTRPSGGDAAPSIPATSGAPGGDDHAADLAPPPVGVERPVDGGLVLVRIPPEDPAFNLVAYNQRVELRGTFAIPGGKRNPGGFDSKTSLRNRGIYRTMTLGRRTGTLTVEGDVGTGNPFYRLALYLRRNFLITIKRTMPYPESAFLAGVTLGLRGGLSPKTIQEFRSTGISHVLAVSGLHVTIIAALFYGVFTIMGVRLRLFAPLIVFFLFTFALIVGWPPSAVRAALMNSLFLLSRAYLRESGFRMSILFSLAVSAFYILMMSPLYLTEPAFTLSFMAIFSLAMFTDPSEELLKGALRGPGLYLCLLVGTSYYLAIVLARSLVNLPWFFPASGILLAGTLLISRRLAERSQFTSVGFEMLPGWLRSYMASQLAIFLGMMGPLSAFYFGTMSLSGPLANVVAIPLIGVIVQLGVFACIIGTFVPVIGIYIALVINAANYLAVKIFLGMATVLSRLIPFPKISQPTFVETIAFYVLVHLFFFHREIATVVGALYHTAIEMWAEPGYRRQLAATAGVLGFVVLFGAGLAIGSYHTQPDLLVTMLDVGYGSAMLVETPGRTMLIDAGGRDRDTDSDSGLRVVLSALSAKRRKGIDAVILTSPQPERIAGLVSILEHQSITTVYCAFPVPTDRAEVPFSEFYRQFSLGDSRFEQDRDRGILRDNPPNNYWEACHQTYRQLVAALRRHPRTRIVELAVGTPIDGFTDLVTVLAPNRRQEVTHLFYDQVALELRTSAGRMVVCPGSVLSVQPALSEPVEVLFCLTLPYPKEEFAGLLASGRVRRVAVSHRRPPRWMFDRFRLGQGLYAATLMGRERSLTEAAAERPSVQIFRTDRHGAVEAAVRRDRLEVTSYLKPEAAR